MVAVIALCVNKQSVHDSNRLHKRLRPDVPGYIITRLPVETFNAA